MPAKVVTIPNVKLVRTGTWSASTGVTTIAREDLDDMVLASTDPDVDEAPIKLGHTDPINDALLADGVPALGWIENLRVEDEEGTGRQVLVGDLKDVPEPLAQVLPLAYKRRSAEIAWVVRTAGGKRYRAALTALSLLGKYAPAVKGLGEPIESLEDLYALYGLAEPTERVLETALTADTVSRLMGAVWAEETKNLEMTSELADAINLDAVRDAWRDAHPYDPETPSSDSWVREVWLSPGSSGGFLIVEGGDLEPNELLRVPWSVTEDGSIELGEGEKVEVSYTPAELSARTAIAAQAKAGAIDAGTKRTLLAAIPVPRSATSANAPAENPPHSGEPGDNGGKTDPQEGPVMDTKRMQELLDNEDEAAAIEALKKLRTEAKGETPPADPPATEPPTEGGETKPEGETPPATEPEAKVDDEDPLLVKLSAGSWDEVQADLAAARDLKKKDHDRNVKAALRTALREGRISPAEDEVKAWTDRLDKDLEGTTSLLASLQPRFSTYEVGDDLSADATVDEAAFDAFERSVFGDDFAPNAGGN